MQDTSPKRPVVGLDVGTVSWASKSLSKTQDTDHGVLTLWTLEPESILRFVEHGYCQPFVQSGPRSAVFLVVSHKDLCTLFTAGFLGYLFHSKRIGVPSCKP